MKKIFLLLMVVACPWQASARKIARPTRNRPIISRQPMGHPVSRAVLNLGERFRTFVSPRYSRNNVPGVALQSARAQAPVSSELSPLVFPREEIRTRTEEDIFPLAGQEAIEVIAGLEASEPIRNLKQETLANNVSGISAASAQLFERQKKRDQATEPVPAAISPRRPTSFLTRSVGLRLRGMATTATSWTIMAPALLAQERTLSDTRPDALSSSSFIGLGMALGTIFIVAMHKGSRAVKNWLIGTGIGLGTGVSTGFFVGLVRYGDSDWRMVLFPMLASAAYGALAGGLIGTFKDTKLMKLLGRVAAGASLGVVVTGLWGLALGAGWDMLNDFPRQSMVLVSAMYAATWGAGIGALSALFGPKVANAMGVIALGSFMGSILGVSVGCIIGLVMDMVLDKFPIFYGIYGAGFVGALGAIAGGIAGFLNRNSDWGSGGGGGDGNSGLIAAMTALTISNTINSMTHHHHHH